MPSPIPIYLLDGGLGTTLADSHSCIFNDDTPLWSSHLLITSPTTLLAAQTSFADAGADVIISATYQSSFEGFRRTRIDGKAGDGRDVGVDEDEAGRLMRSAVKIAREAFESAQAPGSVSNGQRSRKGKVALSLGAYGATMIPSQEYSGKYDAEHITRKQLADWHSKRLEVFLGDEKCWEDVNYVAFETLPRIEEVSAVRDAMARVRKGREREWWISCVFPGDENVLPYGSEVRDVVGAMLGGEAPVPMGIGINCTKMGKIEGLILEFEDMVGELVDSGKLVEWPCLVIYPDGTNGEVYNTVTKKWEKKDSDQGDKQSWNETLFGIVSRVRERGLWRAIFVGGCCKATPDDIMRLRKRIDLNS